MREKLMHFFNIGTKEAPKYELLGDGITSLTEEFNPETESKHYINKAAASSSVKSYAPSISVEKEYIKEEALQNWINEKIKVLPTGADAESDYIRINILEGATAEGMYPAVKRPCTYQFDSIGGDAGNVIMNNMTITGNGDAVYGTFNVKDKTFTENAAESGTQTVADNNAGTSTGEDEEETE